MPLKTSPARVLDREILEAFKIRCAQIHVTMRSAIEEAIRQWLQTHKP